MEKIIKVASPLFGVGISYSHRRRENIIKKMINGVTSLLEKTESDVTLF